MNSRRRGRSALCLLVLAPAVAAVLAAAPPTDPGAPHVEGEVLVKFRATAATGARTDARDRLGAQGLRRFRNGVEQWRVGAGRSVAQAIATLRDDPQVEYAEPNYIVNAEVAPSDPRYPELWGLHNTGQSGGTPGADIDAERAWTVTTGSPNVVVAVIDSGIDYTHPDLAANMWTNPGEIAGNALDDDGNGYVDDVRGWDFINRDNDPFDDLGHGTHCAGTIGAVAGNGIGVAGVSWRVSLVALKFLGADGTGNTADAVAAVEYATSIGADITNNSWGGGGYSQALLDAIRAASAANVLFVAAAGNSGSNNDFVAHYPSNYDAPNVIAVAATDRTDTLAGFSSYGATTVDLGAPGVDVLSTIPGGGYTVASGTSMATPHVSGAAALVRAAIPGLPVDALKTRLLASVDPVPLLAVITVTGGRLNAFLALSTSEAVPPSAVVDLAAGSPTSFSTTLTWTAPGDDGDTGTAYRYDVRYATAPFDQAEFDAALRVADPPDPQVAGSHETLEVRGLVFATTYYFAIRAMDEWGNQGPISNLASATTLGAPDVALSPSSVSADLITGATTTRTVTIENTGAGHLTFDASVRGTSGQTVPASATVSPPPDEPTGPAWDAGRGPSVERDGPRALGELSALTSGLRIVLLESGADVSEIQSYLAAFADVSAVDVLAGDVATLDALASYDAAIVVASSPWGDPNAVGDVLADYADAGHGVVLTLASFVTSWSVRGRFDSEGYSPLIGTAGPIGSSSLGDYDATHPIFAGVTSAIGDLLAEAHLAPGAEWVADWAFGQPLVATKGGNVVAVNVFVGTPGNWAGDVPLLLHNAAAWSAGSAAWLKVGPTSGIVPPGESVELTLTFDAAGLFGGDYDAELHERSNDPDEPDVSAPVHLHVTGAPDIEVRLEPVLGESSATYSVDGALTTHSLTLARPPGVPGVIELIAEGDFGDSSERATVSVEGTVLGSVGSVGSDCQTTSQVFPISAAQLAAFAADGVVQIEVQNSPNVNVFCSVNRHTVRLRYEPPADRLEFAPLFIGLTATLPVTIENAGTDTLHVTSVVSDRPEFTVDASSVTLGPGETMLANVTFAPPTAGRIQGTLSIASDDPDEPTLTLGLVGEGLVPPDIALDPTSVSESLLTGQSIDRTVTIENHGGSDLTFEIGIDVAPAVVPFELPSSLVLATELPFGATPTDRAGAAPVPSEPFTLAGATVLLVQDVAPWSSSSNEQVLAANGIAFDRTGSAGLATVDLTHYRMVLVASDQPTSFYNTVQAHMARLHDFVSQGGVLEFHGAAWGWNGGDASGVVLPGGTSIHYYASYSNYVVDPLHPLVVGLPSSIEPYASHAYLSPLPSGAHVVVTDDQSQPTLVVHRFGSGWVVASSQTLEFGRANGYTTGQLLANMIPYSHALQRSWLQVGSQSGIVPAGGSVNVTLTLDATGLNGGDYTSSLVLASNDPDEPVLTVPVQLHVTGAPDVTVGVSPAVFESSVAYASDGAHTIHDLSVAAPPAVPGVIELVAEGDYGASIETATLTVEGVMLGSVGGVGADCTAAQRAFPISAAQLAAFAADGVVHAEVQNSTSVNLCSVNRHTVRLRYEPPADRLEFGRLFIGRTRTLGFVVGNSGTDPLHVTSVLSDRPEFTVAASALTLAPGETQPLSATFAPLTEGLIEGTLSIASDDPDEPTLTLRLVGEGLVPPDIAVVPTSISESLLTGQSVDRTVTIENRGGSDLTFDIGIDAAPVLAPIELPSSVLVTSESRAGATPTDSAGAALVPSTPFALAGATVLLVQDVAPWSTSSNEEVLAANGIAFDRVTSAGLTTANLSRYDMVLVASDQTTPFYDTIQSQMTRLRDFVHQGGVLEFHGAAWGWNFGDASGVTLPDGPTIHDYLSHYNYVVALDHPLVHGLSNPFGQSASHGYFADLPLGTTVVTTDDQSRPTLVVYRFGAGSVVASCQTLEYGRAYGYATGLLLANMIPYSHALPNEWLAVAPPSGVVPAGGSLDLTLTLDATGLFGGDYASTVVVTSNDPDGPETTVSVQLHVTGAPDVTVGVAPLRFDSSIDFTTDGERTTHTLAVPTAPGGPGEIHLVADGDYGDSFETATLTVEGVMLGSVGGVGADCTTAERVFPISAAQLAAFAADGVVRIDVQNSPSVNVLCAVNRHTVQLGYERPADRLEFGALFIGQTRSLGVTIENAGTDTLHVTSVLADGPEFTVDPASPTLAPGETHELSVTFAPLAAGPIEGTLAIASDDPDEPTLTLRLVGEGLVPPDIALTPTSITEDLLSGQAVDRTVRIENQGGSDLTYEIGIDASPAVVPFDLPSNLVVAAERPVGSTPTDPAGATLVPSTPFTLAGATVLLVQDYAPWSSISNEQVLAANGISFDRIGSAGLATVDLTPYRMVLVPSDQPTFYYAVLQSQMARLNDFVFDGGVLEFHGAAWGYNGGNSSGVVLPGGASIPQFYQSYTNYVVDPAHPLAAGVPSAIEPYASHTYLSTLPSGTRVVTTDDLGRPTLVVYRFGSGSVVASSQTLEYGRANGHTTGQLLANMIPYSHSLKRSWLHVGPPSGVVPAGGSLDLTLTIDSTGLYGGNYASDLFVASNDPDEPVLTVPVQLHVTGVPDVALRIAPVIIESGQPFTTISAATSHQLPVDFVPSSPGVFELIADGDYGSSSETATLDVEGTDLGSIGGVGSDCLTASGTFQVSAAQLASFAADGVIRAQVRNSGGVDVICAVNRHTVRLRYDPPADRLEFGTLFIGASRTLSLAVENPGTDVLHVTTIASNRADYSASVASLTLGPGESQTLSVTFAPQAPGPADGLLIVSSDDPDEPTVTLPLVGEALVAPDIAVDPTSVSVDLLSGEHAVRTLTVLNHGGSDLAFAVGSGASGIPLALPTAVFSGVEPTFGATPTDAEGRAPTASQPLTLAGATVLLVQDYSPWNTTSNEQVLAANGIAFDRVTSDGLATADLTRYRMVLVAADQPTSFYAAIGAQMTRIEEFLRRGGVLEFHAAGWGYNGGDASLVTLPQGVGIEPYTSFWNYVVDPNHPLVVGLPSAFGQYASLSFLTGVPAGADIVATDDRGLPTLAVYRVGSGTVVVGCQSLEYARAAGYPAGVLLDNMIPYSHGLFYYWLDVEPTSGIVPAGGMANLTLAFDATGLYTGNYSIDLQVTSNDPDEPELTVPVQMHVTGAPDVDVRIAPVLVESTRFYYTNGAVSTHVLAAPIPSPGPGSFELLVEGDYATADRTATIHVEGSDLGSIGGTGNFCSTASGAFPVSSAQLAGFTADGLVRVEVRNSSTVGTNCPSNSHTVRLRYDLPQDRLEFGALYVGLSRQLPLRIENPGTDTLHVTTIATDRPEFVPSITAFALEPTESQLVTVTFTPTVPGTLDAALRIESDDPDEPALILALSGTGLVAPDIAIDPTEIHASVPLQGSATRTLTVHNEGGADLSFAVGLGSNGAPLALPEEVLTGTRAPWSTPNVAEGPSAPPSTPVSLAGATVLLVQDYAPWNTASNEQVLAAHGIAFDRVGSTLFPAVDLTRYRMMLVAGDQPTAFYVALQAQAARLDEFVQRGGVLEFHAAGWGYHGGDASLVTLPGGMTIHPYLSFYNYVVDPAHPLASGIPQVFGDYASHAYFSNVPTGAAIVTSDVEQRPTLAVYGFGGGTVVASTHTLEYGLWRGLPTGTLLTNMILFSQSLSPEWLRIAPSVGTVPPGGSVDLTVTFDAAELTIGAYDAAIRISSDDPDEADLAVPVHLQVLGLPDMALVARIVAESSQSFSTDGALTTHPIPVGSAPIGGGTLELIAEGDYSAATERATVTAEGFLLGTLNATGIDCVPASRVFALTADRLAQLAADGTVSVDVQNSPNVNPVCAVNRHTLRLTYERRPDRLDFGSVVSGSTRDVALRIENHGTTALEVSSLSTDRPEFFPSVSSLVLAPGVSQELTVTFAPSIAGPLASVLTLETNDPDQPTIAIPLTGEGLGPPEIEVTPETLDETVLVGSRSTRELTVHNHGATELTFAADLFGQPIGSVTPFTGSVAPGSSVVLQVDFDAQFLDPDTYRATIRVSSNDPWTPEVFVPATMHARTNAPPLARAGDDATVRCASSAGSDVLLDGSASSDPDASDDIVAYEWFVDYGAANERLLATGVSATVVLPLGENRVTLRVTDRFDARSTDEVIRSVYDDVPPVLACPAQAVLECPADTSRSVTGEPDASDVCSAVTLSLHDVTVPGCGQTSSTSRAWTATDSSGNITTCTQSIVVQDTTPPQVEPPLPLTSECSALGGTPESDSQVAAWLASASAVDTCGAAYVHPEAPAFFPLGSSAVSFRATDECGNEASAPGTIAVVDTVAPSISVALQPAVLWPPNHRLIDVAATIVATDVCSMPTVTLSSATSNEPDNGDGDGDTVGDVRDAAIGTPDDRVSLRAERAGGRSGRTYAVRYTAVDAAQHATSTTAFAVVPPDQGPLDDPLTLTVGRNGIGTVVSWTAVESALSYDVIRGSLSNLRDAGPVFDLGPVECIEADSIDSSTVGVEDQVVPPPGTGFFYLVQFNDGTDSSYGTVSAAKPRAPQGGGCVLPVLDGSSDPGSSVGRVRR